MADLFDEDLFDPGLFAEGLFFVEDEDPDPPGDTDDDSWLVIGRRRGRR